MKERKMKGRKMKEIPEGVYKIKLTKFRNQKHKNFIGIIQDGPQEGKGFQFKGFPAEVDNG
jgi:hypothetical protein